MAATKKVTEEVAETTAYDPEELVDYFAELSREKQKDIFVCVNGENIQIKRGEHVKIKRKFYDVLMNQQEMDALALRRIEENKAK